MNVINECNRKNTPPKYDTVEAKEKQNWVYEPECPVRNMGKRGHAGAWRWPGAISFLAPGCERCELRARSPVIAHLITRLLSPALWQHTAPPERIYDLKIYSYLPQATTCTSTQPLTNAPFIVTGLLTVPKHYLQGTLRFHKTNLLTKRANSTSDVFKTLPSPTVFQIRKAFSEPQEYYWREECGIDNMASCHLKTASPSSQSQLSASP